jgi:hypothetical protein
LYFSLLIPLGASLLAPWGFLFQKRPPKLPFTVGGRTQNIHENTTNPIFLVFWKKRVVIFSNQTAPPKTPKKHLRAAVEPMPRLALASLLKPLNTIVPRRPYL